MLRIDGVVVVEVLDAELFAEFHLPGAINVPWGDQFEARIRHAAPDTGAPVILYCYDADGLASRLAADRMDALGYQEVYNYEAGKVDWKAAGLPSEP